MIAIFLIWFWIERQFTVKSVNVILRVTYFIFKTLYISTLSFCFLYYGRYLSLVTVLVTNYYGWFIFDFLTQVTRSSFSYFECNCANSAFVDESANSSFTINRIIKSCVSCDVLYLLVFQFYWCLLRNPHLSLYSTVIPIVWMWRRRLTN